MTELKLVNCQPLTEEESNETNGGWVGVAVAGGLLLVGAAAGLYDAYTESKSKKKKK